MAFSKRIKTYLLAAAAASVLILTGCYESGDYITVTFLSDSEISVDITTKIPPGEKIPERIKKELEKTVLNYENGNDFWEKRFTAAEASDVVVTDEKDGDRISAISRSGNIGSVDELNQLLKGLPVFFKCWDEKGSRILEMYPTSTEAVSAECARKREALVDRGAGIIYRTISSLKDIYGYIGSNPERKEILLSKLDLFPGAFTPDDTELLKDEELLEEETGLVDSAMLIWGELLGFFPDSGSLECFQVMDTKLEIRLHKNPGDVWGWQNSDYSNGYRLGQPSLDRTLEKYLMDMFSPDPFKDDIGPGELSSVKFTSKPLPFEADIRNDLRRDYELPVVYRLVWELDETGNE